LMEYVCVCGGGGGDGCGDAGGRRRAQGERPLHLACKIGHAEVADALLAARARVNEKTVRGPARGYGSPRA
jgi:hypothetical protein